MPDCNTIKPKTTDAKPLGPNHAIVIHSRHGSALPARAIDRATGRTANKIEAAYERRSPFLKTDYAASALFFGYGQTRFRTRSLA
jgi:hypothetical protein